MDLSSPKWVPLVVMEAREWEILQRESGRCLTMINNELENLIGNFSKKTFKNIQENFEFLG
jgi:hypothetical protein